MQVVGIGHNCQIHIKWSNSTTTEKTAQGVDKEGSAEENRQNNIMVIQRSLVVMRKVIVHSAMMRSR